MTTRQDPCPAARVSFVLLPFLLLAAACAARVQEPGAEWRRGTAAYVIEGSRLTGAPLWASLPAHVPGLRASRSAGSCPAITLRRGRNATPIATPLVYVDGTPTFGTCALAEIAAWDVERVEVYPGGASHRPGYRTAASGLILIFLRRD